MIACYNILIDNPMSEETTLPILFDNADSRVQVAQPDLAVAPLTGMATYLYAARETCAAGYTGLSQPLPHLTVFLTERDEATVTVGEQTLRHQPGTLLLVSEGNRVYEQAPEWSRWRVAYLFLAGPLAAPLNLYVERIGSGAIAFAQAAPSWQRAFERLIDAVLRQPPGWAWSVLSDFAYLSGEILHSPLSAEEDTVPDVIAQVEQVIRRDPDRAWSVGEIARALRMDERRLAYRFSRATAGLPIATWVRQRRVSEARRLLGQGLSVTQVSERLGFANPYHFSRVYKSVTGHSPSEVTRAVTLSHRAYHADVIRRAGEQRREA